MSPKPPAVIEPRLFVSLCVCAREGKREDEEKGGWVGWKLSERLLHYDHLRLDKKMYAEYAKK